MGVRGMSGAVPYPVFSYLLAMSHFQKARFEELNGEYV